MNARKFCFVALAMAQLFCFMLLVSTSYADVLINEIMYAPNSNWGGENNEWIELFNNGTENASVANWIIDGKNISEGIVPVQGYLILAKNTTKHLEVYGQSSVRVPFTLTNIGKALYLKSADGSTSDFFDYTEYAASGMAKNNNLTLERNASGWFESVALGGTPGAQNSVLSYSAPPVQPVQNQTNEPLNQTENITEEQTETPSAPQNQEAHIPASIELIRAPETMKFGDYSSIRAKFSSGSRDFEKARFVAYIYKPSWIARDLSENGTTLRNSPYNSGAAAEITDIAANETHYLVLPLFLKCNTEGYANAAYTARVRAYIFENSEWRALAESDRNIFVSGESETCKKEIAKETTCINKTVEKNCTEKIRVLRDASLEINATYPEIIFAGENFKTNVFIKNNGETLRDIEIYSYIYEHSQIMSSGFDGAKWGNARTANSKKVTLYGGNSTTIELISRARENTTAEKYTYKVRFDDLFDDKKSEERIYLIELAARNTSEMHDIKNETLLNSTEAKNRITGNLLAEKTKLQNLSFLDRIIYKIKGWLM